MKENNSSKTKNSKREKSIIRIIIAVIGILLLLIAGFAYALNRYFNSNVKEDFETVDESGQLPDKWKDNESLNVLVVGLEETRTDMIMVVSYNPKRNDLSMISVPRDTYVENEYSDPTFHKINSVYAIPKLEGGIERLASQVSKKIGVPINHYVILDYKGVRNIVNAVGGVDVEIEQNMYYKDPSAKPPLNIYFEKGPTTIMGDEAIEYLRWRKNSDGTGANGGDIARVQRQQDFIVRALEKALHPDKIVNVVNAIFKNVKTSLSLKDVLVLAKNAVSMEREDIKTYQAVGYATQFNGLWYYLSDDEKNYQLMEKIMNGIFISEEDLKPSDSFMAKAMELDKSSYTKRNSIKTRYYDYEKEEENPVGETIVVDVSDKNTEESVIFEGEGTTDDVNATNPEQPNSDQPNTQNQNDNSNQINQNNNQTSPETNQSEVQQSPDITNTQETPQNTNNNQNNNNSETEGSPIF